MKQAFFILFVALIALGLIGAQSKSIAPQQSSSIIISCIVEDKSLISFTKSWIDIEFNQTKPASPFEFQCIAGNDSWWTMMIQSTNNGFLVDQSNPLLKKLYKISIPALVSEAVNLNQSWKSSLIPPTSKEGLKLDIEIIFDQVPDFLPGGIYTDQLVFSIVCH